MVETAKLYSEINATDFISKQKSDPDAVVLDVRTPAEFADGHIPGAINKDVTSVDFINQLDEFDKTRTYLVYCRSGARSTNACVMMGSRGLKTFNLIGGIMHWSGPIE